MKKLFFIIIPAILLLPVTLVAQNGNYNIYNYSTDNGFPSNDYQYVFQDSYGYLWLASYDGLFRWDGYSFKKYDHDEHNPKSIDGNIVYSILEDSHRRLWIGTIEGLNLYDRRDDSFIHCNIRQRGQKVPVNAIIEDAKHQLWLGTSSGLCRYDQDKQTTHWYYNKTDDDVIFCLTADKNCNIWAGTYNGGVKKFSPVTKKFTTYKHLKGATNTISGNKIKSILADHNDNIWVGTADAGVDELNDKGNIISHFSTAPGKKSTAQNSINCLYEDKHHTVWMGVSRETLYYKDENDPSPRPLTSTVHGSDQNRLLSVSAIHGDSFGNTWFATNGNGLFYTNSDKNVFENYLQKPGMVTGLNTTVTTCFYEDKRGKVWIGTDMGGFFEFDPVKKTFIVHNIGNSGLSSNSINDIKEDKYGKLWLATWGGGVMQFDPASNRLKKYVNNPADMSSLIGNDVKTILPDDSLIWIGTHGNGLAVFNMKHQQFIHAKDNTVYPFNMGDPAWINHLFKDSKKRLWISTYSGVYVLQNNQLRHFIHTDNAGTISDNAVNMVTEDNKGRIWLISESGGLDLFDEAHKQFIRVKDKYNLPKTMKAIIADKNDVLWISSNEGIIAFNTITHSVKRYDANDGLQDNSFFQKAALQSRNGLMYFGGPRGFNVFNPAALKPVHIPSYFYFTDLYVYNELQKPDSKNSPLKQVLSFTSSITLTHSQSFFSVEFASINLYSPGKTQYAYTMDGLHNQWINIANERKVSFTNLDAGKYTLRIRYTGIDGEWINAPASLNIIVLPPWWATWWFRTIAIILLAASAMGVFYLRVSSIKRRNRFLKTEVAKRTHELSELNLFLQERNEEVRHQKDRLQEYNTEILRQSDKILDQQKHISAQNQKLECTVSELQKLNNTKDHFFSILAHDLKNPVSALSGIVDFIRKNFMKLDRRDLQEYLNSIHKSSNAVYDLLVNLLNWSRTQSKNIDCTPIDFNLEELVQKNIALLSQQFANKHITLNIDVSPSHWIFADYNMVDTVVRNLLSNSIKFTDYNGRVGISSVIDKAGVQLNITDNGIGMSAKQVEKLFSVDKNNISIGTAGEKGTGLGLVISKEFIAINNGSIEVKSEEGKGSSFCISLPLSAISPVRLKSPKEKENVPLKAETSFWDTFPTDEINEN